MGGKTREKDKYGCNLGSQNDLLHESATHLFSLGVFLLHFGYLSLFNLIFDLHPFPISC